MLNRKAIKSFIRCAHFLARQHIPHATNFDKLVELVFFCGGEDLKNFLDRTGRNAVYISHVAVVQFVEVLEIWVEGVPTETTSPPSYFSIMTDEYIYRCCDH